MRPFGWMRLRFMSPRAPLFAARLRKATAAAAATPKHWHYVAYDRLVLPAGADPRSLGLVLVESTHKASRRDYHKRKLAFVLSNARHFALEQAERGYAIRYVGTDLPFAEALVGLQLPGLSCFVPAERELREELEGLPIEQLPDETWVSTTEDFAAACPRAPYRMERFYAHMRRRTGLLMERGKPIGGRLSLDEENRKPWRGEPVPPARPRFLPDDITREVLELVEARFPSHFGTLDDYAEPASHDDAERVWAFALDELLVHFGPYEDAMSRVEPDLFHARISALMNVGRLMPRRVLDDVAQRYAAGELPLSSAEGFIRQILGWREYVRHVHAVTDGFRKPPLANPLAAHRPLPPVYWGTPSGMRCMDTVVGEVVRTGFSHHITRLMVLGNLATLAGYAPRELSDWFWLAYIDAYDWVVEPNVLGMATYADGGRMTTKPYVSGAAYIDKMSDYCKGCALDPKRSTGEGACPMTALYWTFLDRNREALAGNQRMALPLRALEKRPKDDLRLMREHADRSIEKLAAGQRLDDRLV